MQKRESRQPNPNTLGIKNAPRQVKKKAHIFFIFIQTRQTKQDKQTTITYTGTTRAYSGRILYNISVATSVAISSSIISKREGTFLL